MNYGILERSNKLYVFSFTCVCILIVHLCFVCVYVGNNLGFFFEFWNLPRILTQNSWEFRNRDVGPLSRAEHPMTSQTQTEDTDTKHAHYIYNIRVFFKFRYALLICCRFEVQYFWNSCHWYNFMVPRICFGDIRQGHFPPRQFNPRGASGLNCQGAQGYPERRLEG